MNTFNLINNISTLMVYAKVLLSKFDYIQASLIACKVHDILALSEENEKWLRENNHIYRTLGNVSANEKICFLLENYLLNNLNKNEKTLIINNIIKSRKYNTNISRLRNNLIHNHMDFQSVEYKNDTKEIIDRLLQLPFIKKKIEERFGVNNEFCNYEIERDIKSAIGIHGKSEISMTRPDFPISAKSFENLIESKADIFLILRDILQDEVKNKYLDIENIQISTVDSTSAYVWLTIPLKINSTVTKQALPDKYSIRPKLYVPTISVLMTPLEIWVYLEFAGFTYYYKMLYYDYIINFDRFDKLVHHLTINSTNDSVKFYPCLRNVHWYVFENMIYKLTDLDAQNRKEYHRVFSAELKQSLQNKKEMFLNSVKSNQPISWNLALAGWIYPYSSFSSNEITVNELASNIQNHIANLNDLLEYFYNIQYPFSRKYEKIEAQYIKLIS